MACKEDSFGSVALEGGKLIIYSNDIEISSVNVPIPNLGAEKSRDSVVEDEEYFNDDFGNGFRIDVYSGIYGIDYTIENTHREDELKAKEFCESLTVEFKSFEVNPYENEEDFFEEEPYIEPTKFFTIKTSQKPGIEKLLDFFTDNNTDDIFTFGGLTQLYNDVEKDNLVFVVAGGDKAKIGFDYTQGLYGVARVVKAPYEKEGKSYKIDFQFIYFFKSVVTQQELYDYKETINIPNVGITVGKGEQNQAISNIKIEKAKAIMLAVAKIKKIPSNVLFSLFPWVQDESKQIATENYKSIIDTHPAALNVVNIAKVFANYLVHYNSKHTSTLIGIFGKWGRGKTYFYEKMKEYIENPNTDKDKTFYFCTFQPWKYQKQESAWAYLYQQILESYLKKDIDVDEEENDKGIVKKTFDNVYQLINKVKKVFLLNINRLGYWKFIYPTISILLIGYWTFFLPFEEKFNLINSIIGMLGISGVIILYKSYSFYMKSKDTAQSLINNYGKVRDYSNYLGFQNEIEKELCHLLETYIDENNERLILFVDDLDRCNEEMIIDIIDGLKLVLDNKKINSRLTIITAVDERILKKSIKHKYLNKKISSDVGTKEYIEKFFLMGIKLNHLNDGDIEELVEVYTKELNKSNKIVDNNETTTQVTHTDDNETTTQVTHTDDNKTTTQVTHTDDNKTTTQGTHTNDSTLQVLNEDEITSIKEILKKYNFLTPRKINIIIHRYLIFKSLIFLVMKEVEYDKFDQKMLIELLVTSQKKKNLEKYIKHYSLHTTYEIPIPLKNFVTDKINRKEYIILIKFAEMVSPF